MAALTASLLLTWCRLFTPSSRLLVMATALVPFALVGYVVAALGWWLVRRLGSDGRRPVSTGALVVALVGVALHAGLLAPAYLGSHASGRPDLTVMTSNLLLGDANTSAVTRLAVAQKADVVVLEEITAPTYAALSDLREDFPHVAGQPTAGSWGTVVLSRYPLEQVTQLPVSKGTWQVRVDAPKPFWLIGVHTGEPTRSVVPWGPDHDVLLSAVRRLRGPVVVAGDFNATLDHRPMRQLLGLGLADAARQANSGWQPTWPGDRRAAHAMPFGLGLMALDHVLVSKQFSAISTSTHVVTGSDHRALVARLAFS